MPRLREKAQSVWPGCTWARSLAASALLALLATGCVDSDNEKAERAAALNDEIKRFAAEKGGQSGVTGAGASVVAKQAQDKATGGSRTPGSAASVNKPQFNPSGAGPGNFGRPVIGVGRGRSNAFAPK